MEVFEPLSAFFLTISGDVKIGVTHISLYMALLHYWNINKRENPILINRNEIMKAAKINARYTYNKCINDLNNYGYIKYIPSSNPSVSSKVFLNLLKKKFMDTFFIPTEKDFKEWIKEAIKEYQEEFILKNNFAGEQCEELLNRKEIAKRLRISLVTLTDWVKRGLPSHKQRGRVYFIYAEVMEYIKKNKLRHCLNYTQ